MLISESNAKKQPPLLGAKLFLKVLLFNILTVEVYIAWNTPPD